MHNCEYRQLCFIILKSFRKQNPLEKKINHFYYFEIEFVFENDFIKSPEPHTQAVDLVHLHQAVRFTHQAPAALLHASWSYHHTRRSPKPHKQSTLITNTQHNHHQDEYSTEYRLDSRLPKSRLNS